MCLTLELDTKKRKAKEDIPCVKQLLRYDFGDTLVSPFMGASYVYGELKKARIGKVNKVTSVDFSAPLGEDGMFPLKDYHMIHAGLHSYGLEDGEKYVARDKVFRGPNSGSNVIFCHAVIPKGATYYEGKFGPSKSYVSNQLIVKGEICN